MNRTTLLLVAVLALALLSGCGTTVSAEAREEAAIREALVDVLGEGFDFTISRFKVVRAWAGALVVPTDPHLEGGAFLLYREGTGWWRVVDFGTGYGPEEWMAGGAPRELAEWF